ncbi:preprotein translocase subunit SecE [Mycoplasma testudineum]|nr:preprotein translocase subunit SecE [Mycoplasma testudineum]
MKVRKSRKRNWLLRQSILFVKELKRVRWPTLRVSWVAFGKIIIFTIIFSLFVFALATGATAALNAIGVGVSNG